MSSTRSNSGRQTPLRRGTACLTCRQRKIKCDGVRPICGSCSESWPEECEYYDGGPSRNQLLQEEISVLETRLQGLENPSNPPPQVTLYDPYRRAGQESSSAGLTQELSTNMRRSLIRSFLSSASQFGFFLDMSKFTSSVTSDATQWPADFLLSSIYLFSAYLSPVRDICAQQPMFLAQTFKDATQSLSSNHPQKIIHTIQAEVILSQYLFSNGRLLEGKYHLGTAVSIVIGAGFHKIRAVVEVGSVGYGLVSPAADSVEEGERINALWTVLAMSNCWAATEGAESGFPYNKPESRIDAPWPLDIATYSENPFPAGFRSSYTIQNFLMNTQDNATSILALFAKASVLFEQSSLLSRHFRPDVDPQEFAQMQASYTNTMGLLKRFIRELRPIAETDPRNVARPLLTIHTLAHVSAIQLHGLFAAQDLRSQNEVFLNAEAVVALLRNVNLGEFPFVDPIMGHLWLITARVIVDQIAGIRSGRSRLPQRYRSVKEIAVLVETVISAMGILSPHSPLIESQLAEVHSTYNAALA